MQPFASRLRKYRRKCNLSTRELGEKVGFSQYPAQTVLKYEKNRIQNLPPKELIEKFAEVLNVSPEDLTGNYI